MGGQLQAVVTLVQRGGNRNWVGWDDLTPLDAAEAAGAGELVVWLRAHGGRKATELG